MFTPGRSVGITLLVLMLALAATASARDCAIRAVTSYDWDLFNVVLLPDGTWTAAFSEDSMIGDFVLLEIESVEYFPVDHAREDEFFPIPEHLTITLTAINRGTAGISTLTYSLLFSNRFGDSLGHTSTRTALLDLAPDDRRSLTVHLERSDVSEAVFLEAKDGVLRTESSTHIIQLWSGFTFPLDRALPSIPDAGRLAFSESGERVLLFPSHLWDYEAPKNAELKDIIVPESSLVEYFPVSSAASDSTYVTPEHVLVTVVVANQSDRSINGFGVQVRIVGTTQYTANVELASFSELSTASLEPNETIAFRYLITSPGSELIQAIHTGAVNTFLYVERISFVNGEALKAAETCFRDVVCSSVVIHSTDE